MTTTSWTDFRALVYPAPDALSNIMTDASDVAVGAVLQQYIDDEWRPITYFSQKLKPAETRYSTSDRELLAVCLTMKHFRHLLEGRQFHILTDHKPNLLTLSLSRADNRSRRQICHLDYISHFTSDIRHVDGHNNRAADALSRIEAVSQQHPVVINFDEMAAAQQNSSEMKEIQTSTFLQLREVPLSGSTTLICV